MIRAVPAGILRQVLLAMVGVEDGFSTKIGRLLCRRPAAGRLSVDVIATRTVDQMPIVHILLW
jgi:hypothetical protein